MVLAAAKQSSQTVEFQRHQQLMNTAKSLSSFYGLASPRAAQTSFAARCQMKTRLQAGSMVASAKGGSSMELSTQAAESTPEMDPKVAGAMAKAEKALLEADEGIDKIPTLPSARLPTAWDGIVRTLKPAVQLSAVLAYCALIHALSASSQAIGGLLLALVVAWWGWRRLSLSASGALAAAVVGWGTLAPSFRAGITLLAFFFSSSKLTRLGDREKAVDEEHKPGGQRDWVQVACNGLVPALLAVTAAIITGGFDMPLRPSDNPTLAALYAAYMGYLSCCCGDTWASELGQLSEEEPRLITSLRPVRKGTNGGVTLVGLAASLVGGLFIGVVFYVAGVMSPTATYPAALHQWPLIPLGMAAGVVGSAIDSVLGATVQFTGYNRRTAKITGRTGEDITKISGLKLLDNNAVNFVSASATAALTALAAVALL